MRAIAVAVAWEDALDCGGDAVPQDPRYREVFLEYLWWLSSRDLVLESLGYFKAREEMVEAERAAFELHLAPDPSKAATPLIRMAT